MKDQYSFTTKNKSHKNTENPFNIYKANKPHLNNKFSDKKNNKKTLASSSTSYHQKNKTSTLSNIKTISSYKETLNKAYSKLYNQLHSYNLSIKDMNIQIINDIIFDENKRIVSVFKDHLIYCEISDFLKQYYKKNKSVKILQRFINYYESYTKFYPEYGPLEDVLKILKKNIKKKKKYLERIEEDEINKYINNKDSQKFERIIKDSEIKTNKTNSKINKSCSTLILDSTDKININNKDIASNRDFYSILKEFMDYNENDNEENNINYNKEELYKINNDIINEKHDNIFIFNSKLSNYVAKTAKENKDSEIKIGKNKYSNISVKSKKYISISPCINILNNILHKKIRKKMEQRKKMIEYGKNNKAISLKKNFMNPLLKSNNNSSKYYSHKYNDSKSLKKYKKTKSKIIKYNIKTHLIDFKPYNTKKIFNSYNKYNNTSIGNNYTLSSYRYSNEWIKSRRSPESNRDNSPLYLRKKIKNLILSSVKNNKRKNHILNFEKIKIANSNINSVRFSNKNSTNSEINNNKDFNSNVNSNNNICIKLKHNTFFSNSGKGINICKKNTIKKISPVNNYNYTTNKKTKLIINKKTLSNPFKLDNHLIINNTINQNIIFNMNNLYSKKSESSSKKDFNSYKYDSKIELKNKEKIKKKHNNVILIKSKINLIKKNNIINSIKNKNNKSITRLQSSFSLKSTKNNSLNKKKDNLTLSNKISKNKKFCFKNYNNILKTAIDHSILRNELNMKSKAKTHLVKSGVSDIKYKNEINKEIQMLKEDKEENKKINEKSKKKYNCSDLGRNTLIKNKIKKNNEINSNKNGNKKARICLKLPINSHAK